VARTAGARAGQRHPRRLPDPPAVLNVLRDHGVGPDWDGAPTGIRSRTLIAGGVSLVLTACSGPCRSCAASSGLSDAPGLPLTAPSPRPRRRSWARELQGPRAGWSRGPAGGLRPGPDGPAPDAVYPATVGPCPGGRLPPRCWELSSGMLGGGRCWRHAGSAARRSPGGWPVVPGGAHRPAARDVERLAPPMVAWLAEGLGGPPYTVAAHARTCSARLRRLAQRCSGRAGLPFANRAAEAACW
jgi:hypothetical protein